MVEQLLEKSPAAPAGCTRRVQGRIVLQAPTDEPNLPQWLARAYSGHESQMADRPKGALV
jgi:hypothetical protein